MIAALIAPLVLAASVRVDFAPDQPLPYVYADDPLIIEIQSDEDVKATARIAIDHAGSAPFELNLGEIALRAKGTRWIPIETAPRTLGPFTARVSVELPEGASETSRVLNRIRRPGSVRNKHLVARVDGNDASTLLALRNVPVDFVATSFDDSLEELAEAVGKLGMQLVVSIALENPPPTEEIERMATAIGGSVARWEIEPGDKPERIAPVAEALAKGTPRTPISLVVSTPDVLSALLETGRGQRITQITIAAGSAAAGDPGIYRNAAEAAGYEGLTYHVRSPGAPTSGGTALRDVLSCIANGAQTVELDSSLFYGESECGPAFASMSAFAHRFEDAVFVGEITAGGAAAHVFRSGGTWMVALWAQSSPQHLSIAVGDASGVSLADAVNNALDAPSIVDGSIRVNADVAPHFISGAGGSVLTRAAWTSAQREARRLASISAGRSSIPPEFFAALTPVTDAQAPAPDRAAFFTILKTLPEIESRWHAGALTRASAVPAIAGATRLARAMSVIEQELGGPFVDPLVDTLGRASEYQSHYLTGASDSNGVHERGDWVLREVTRLVAESKATADGGRPIEGHALGAIAEWRARALQHAAKAAPLSQPEPQRPNLIVGEPAPQPEAITRPVADATPPPAVAAPGGTKRVEYKVVRGDTPMGIARKHKVELDDLMKWNNWTRTPTLRIGQSVVVFVKE